MNDLGNCAGVQSPTHWAALAKEKPDLLGGGRALRCASGSIGAAGANADAIETL